MEKMIGIVEDIIYRNESNGYTIIAVSTDDGEKTAVGTMFQLSVGEEISMVGKTTTHPIYGLQFVAESFTTMIPKDKHAFERYLGSGAIKGVGPVMAKKIVETFQDETFRIIEEEPERLAEIKGISENKAGQIATIFYEQRNLRQAIIFLQEYQISLTYAMKIYDFYKDKTYQILRENPYKLAEDIYGIGFKLADSVAERTGIDKDHPHRIMSAITYVLNQASSDGHVYLEKDELINRTIDLLGIEIEFVDHILLELQMKQSIMIGELDGHEIIYLAFYYQMEEYCGHKVCSLLTHEVQRIHHVDNLIRSFELTNKITLDSIQKDAIVFGSKYPFFVLTGGPGTGKTTSINALIYLFEEAGLTINLAAPTGRAAKRMTETTGYEAKTIHRLLEINFSGDDTRQSFERNEDYPLECDVLILDETSMVDITLFYHVLKAVPLGCRVIMVGDKDQLPSVGAGNVLRDLIHVRRYVPTIVLEKIYRQAEKSAIILNAHKIHQGLSIDYKNKEDFFFIRRTKSHQILEEVISLAKDRLPKFTGVSFAEGIQVLTPMRKGMLGVDQLNTALQKALNPTNKTKAEKVYRQIVFREGDKVMQIRNNYNISWQIMSQYNIRIDEGVGVFNGDMGTIIDINHFSETIKVEFDDLKRVTYEFNQLDELELAYSVTIHKSQGSEYPVVIIPLFKGPSMLLSRNLLYTAVTRAKQMVVLIGDEHILNHMIANNREIHRNSTLYQFIEEATLVSGVSEVQY
jgi:exodeoxyribonuclease V alpha subunit